MADFTYRGFAVADTWPAGAKRSGSQTKYLARRREDGAQRWSFTLPSGEEFRSFTREEARSVIRLLAS